MDKGVGADKASLEQTAYDAIKKMILEGQIRPGDLLSENLLSEYLNMSRTPVREAVRRLQAERIVEFRKGQGTYLRCLTWKELQDICEVRMGLELKACQTAAERIREEEIRELQREFHALRQEYLSGARSSSGAGAGPQARFEPDAHVNPEVFHALEHRLHELILKGSDNQYIRKLMEQINLSVCQYDALLAHLPSAQEEYLRYYMEITDCLAGRNCTQLKTIMRKHLRWSMEMLQQSWNQDDIVLRW